MTRTIIVALLLVFTISAHAQVDRKYIYNTWTDTNRYSSDTLFYVPAATVYKLNDGTKSNPEYANKIVRFIVYTQDNRLLDFNYNLTTHDTVKYNLKATWKWSEGVMDPKIIVTGGDEGWTMTFDLHAITVQPNKMVLRPNNY